MYATQETVAYLRSLCAVQAGLTAAIQEIARALASAQAAAVADALSARIATRTAGALFEVQDVAAMGELVPLLEAVGRISAPDGRHNRVTR